MLPQSPIEATTGRRGFAQLAALVMVVLAALAVAPAGLTTGGGATAGDDATALSAADLAELRAVRPDPRPEALTRDQHYLVSNENKHYLFRAALADRGGIFVGVGAEQNYLMAGWARPEVLVLMDFDQQVVDLHKVYGVIFRAAETPAEFRALWEKQRRDRVSAYIAADFADERERERVERTFRRYWRLVGTQLAAVDTQYRAEGIPTFLSDGEQYAHLARLWHEGRALPLRGDLTARQSMTDLADFARDHGLVVRVLYLSNAEFYFEFTTGNYRQNILALPFDEDSLVVRTVPSGGWSYWYVEQSGLDFQGCLRAARPPEMRRLLRKKRRAGNDEDHFALGGCVPLVD